MFHRCLSLWAVCFAGALLAACSTEDRVSDLETPKHEDVSASPSIESDAAVGQGGKPSPTNGRKQVCRTVSERDVELSQLVGLGATPQQILSSTVGEHTGSLQWLAQSEVVYGPESGSTSLQLTVALAEGPIRYREIEGVSELVSPSLCLDELLIPLELRLTTSGGALSESFRAVASARDLNEVRIAQHIASAALGGSFKLDASTRASLSELELQVAFLSEQASVEIFAVTHADGPGDTSSISRRKIGAAALALIPVRP